MTDFLNEIKEEALGDLDQFFDENTPDDEAKNNDKSSTKVLITHTDDKKLIDTLYNWDKTQFIEYNRDSNNVSLKQKIKIKDTLYYPLKWNSSYIDNSVILFPSVPIDYDSDQQLIDDIRSFIHKYVDIQEELEIICVYYVIMTYFYQKFTEVPYLRVIGDYGSWKSRFLKTIWSLCHYPMMVNGWISTPALFRLLERVKWTLVFDEADLKHSDTTNDIVKILNNWYQKGLSILRADGEKFEPVSYNVYWPKIIWSRNDFSDRALESRCITFIMKRTNRKDIKRNLWEEFEKETQELRDKLLKYKYDNFNRIEMSEEYIDGLEPRLNQIINPLLSIINDRDDKDVVIMNSFNFQEEIKKDRYLSVEWQIFQSIHDLFLNEKSLTYSDIIDWLEYKDKMYPRKLWSILKNHWIVAYRTNQWFRIDYESNKDVLNKHYKEFSILSE